MSDSQCTAARKTWPPRWEVKADEGVYQLWPPVGRPDWAVVWARGDGSIGRLRADIARGALAIIPTDPAGARAYTALREAAAP